MIDDPLFVDPLNDYFMLQSASPCIDAGGVDYPLSDAFGGMPRPFGSGPDIGAYELGAVYLPVVIK
jgi:hypothetical protein